LNAHKASFQAVSQVIPTKKAVKIDFVFLFYYFLLFVIFSLFAPSFLTSARRTEFGSFLLAALQRGPPSARSAPRRRFPQRILRRVFCLILSIRQVVSRIGLFAQQVHRFLRRPSSVQKAHCSRSAFSLSARAVNTSGKR
jgi:hypothetical protein